MEGIDCHLSAFIVTICISIYNYQKDLSESCLHTVFLFVFLSAFLSSFNFALFSFTSVPLCPYQAV